jgi:mRNA interferase MazF
MAEDLQKPPWVKPSIIAAPKIRQVYWCDFWQDARLPEMWKRRPVVVVSYKNSLNGPCLVVPLSTVPQDANVWSFSLVVEGVNCWAVCNQPSTVSPSRFTPFKGKIPVLPVREFNQILEILTKWLPRPFEVEN